MVLAKNYETMSKFAKVMPRILWLLFCGHGTYMIYSPQRLLSDP